MRHFFCYLLLLLLLTPLLGVVSLPAEAATKAKAESRTKAKPAVSAKKKTKPAAASKAKVVRVGKKKKARAPASYPLRDRHAAIVMNAETGEVLYEKNAAAIRYPASLTKMMTLYLTFEALKKGRISLDHEFSVSRKAASQPQTNIALDEGDRLAVRDAIGALVVRSANDAAVVLAEGLGKTEWNFALMMTQKARDLGMKNTVFRNPHGLPDSGQYTTARDMARLGVALRKHFPEYYHFFKLREFSYGGRDYESHNRIVGRYAGADGIKTGYIRLSGFNVVTSVKRAGYTLVGVVMGGQSAGSRDREMMEMLDGTLVLLAGRRKPSEPQAVSAPPEPAAAPAVASAVSEPALWGIQVGAFSNEEQALEAAEGAISIAPQQLSGARVAMNDLKTSSGFLQRVRLEELTEAQARDACKKLAARAQSCLIYRMER